MGRGARARAGGGMSGNVSQKKSAIGSGTGGNPFDRIMNKRRHNILGVKLKGQQKKTGQARERARELRKSTLLKEFQKRGKKGKFVDHRFGEKEEGLSVEEKMLARFQRERTARLKHGEIYNLKDDADEDQLTHLGRSLADGPDDDMWFDDDDSDEQRRGAIDADTVAMDHFGGGEEDRNGDRKERSKTKKERLEEIIAKSKAAKAEKRVMKEKTLELREKLDEDFEALLGTMAFKPPKSMRTDEDDPKPKQDNYDRAVREMAFDMRAQATERSKTAEELAQEEADRLAALEAKRISRMRGDSDSEDDDDESEDESDGGDDDGSSVGSADGDASSDDGEEPEAGDNTGIDEDGSGSDSESSSDDESSGQKKAKDVKTRKNKAAAKAARKRDRMKEAAAQVPYTFDVPETYPEFTELLSEWNTDNRALVIERMIKCNHIKIDPKNNAKKIHRLFQHLVEEFMQACDISDAGDGQQGDAEIGAEIPLTELMVYAKPLFSLSLQMPGFAGQVFRDRLATIQKDLRRCRQGLADGSTRDSWPTLPQLMFIKLASHIFPSSDFQHNVVTPCLILLASVLNVCPVLRTRQLVSGLFCCNLMLSLVRESRRLCPEVLSFLLRVVRTLVPDKAASKKSKKSKKGDNASDDNDADGNSILDGDQAADEGDVRRFRRIARLTKDGLKSHKAGTVDAMPLELVTYPSKADIFTSVACKLSILKTALVLTEQASSLYLQLPSFPELFTPFQAVLDATHTSALPSEVKDLAKRLSKSLKNRLDSTVSGRVRVELVNKPAPEIKMYNPVFEERFFVNQDTDVDRERAAVKKLKRKRKEELKGAMRELRKDNAFLEEERRKKKAAVMAEKEAKTREIMTMLEAQQHQMNVEKYKALRGK